MLSLCFPKAREFRYFSSISYFMSKTITPRFSPFLFLISRLIDKNQRAEFIVAGFFLIGLNTGMSELFIASIYHGSFIISVDMFILFVLSLDTMLPFFPITVIFLIPLLLSKIKETIFSTLCREFSFPVVRKLLISVSTDRRLIIFFSLSTYNAI